MNADANKRMVGMTLKTNVQFHKEPIVMRNNMSLICFTHVYHSSGYGATLSCLVHFSDSTESRGLHHYTLRTAKYGV